ncbi:MAG TPA: CmcJ/NvfI family oxidoreductase [Steroidobacteraceae bacterium]|nr:CmcJ/NvfI family oxidoreductase [Steroidobacteraceae bacterium]
MSAVIDDNLGVSNDDSFDISNDVEAILNYTRDTGVRPVNYTFDPPPGVPRNSGEVDARRVLIRDARQVSGLTLNVAGFELIQHRSGIADWESFQDSELVKAFDYPEVTAALKRHTGADKVVIFDHTLRDSSVGPGNSSLREAVRRVHDDQTLASAPRRVAKHLPPCEAEWRLERRFAIVNFWRPIGGPVLQTPLAVCDARTIESADLLPSDLVYRDWTGETYAVAYNPDHRWYWFPRQSTTEAALLKIYDSATDGRARLTAHSAFDDPHSAPDAPPRRSIEVRAMLFW